MKKTMEIETEKQMPVEQRCLVRPLPEYTYEDGEGPKCPFCETVWTADDPIYYDESGYEDKCSECGNHIRIEPIISVSWKTLPIRWANETSAAAGSERKDHE